MRRVRHADTSPEYPGQLAAGSRYFDIRPAIWQTIAGFMTAHWSYIDGPGLEGAAGQPLGEIMAQVAGFLSSSGCEKEIVILKFSHYLCYQDGNTVQSFTADQMNELVSMVLSSPVVPFKTSTPNINLNSLRPIDFTTGSGGRVLMVFDQFTPSPQQYASGVFSYSDFIVGSGSSLTGNLTVFDCYSNTDSLSYMQADQLGKFRDDTARNAGALMLVSWTLTMSAEDIVNPDPNVCIIPGHIGGDGAKDLAVIANLNLTSQLMSWVNAGYITAGKIPNIILHDLVGQDYTVDFCMMLNKMAAPQNS
jgi:hypothetical protein